MLIRNGAYRYTHEGMGGGVIELDVRVTDRAFTFKLLKNTCRYSPAQMDQLFAKSDKVVIGKYRSQHAMCFSEHFDDWFVIYPFRSGIPFLFELVKEEVRGLDHSL